MLSRLFLIAALAAGPLAAQENLFIHVPDPKSKTRIEAVALFSRPSPSGFLPVRFLVNNGSDQPGKLQINTTSTTGSYGSETSLTSSFEFEAAAEDSTYHDILVPCSTLMNFGGGYSGSTTVNLRMGGSFGSSSNSISAGYEEGQSALLLSESLFTPNASALDNELSTGHRGRGAGGQTFAGRFTPTSMPEDWRAYSGYDGMGMTDADWSAMTPGARNAILRWNRLGGQLVIYALSASTNLASLGISDKAAGVRAADRSFGNVSVVPLGSDLKLDPAATLDLFNQSANLPNVLESIRSDFLGWPLKSHLSKQGYNSSLFILILVAFGVLVGPVNLFVFAKSGRRHRLFITTPLIALGTSALLVALIILIDGFGGRGVRIQLMEIRPDDGDNSAYIFQEQVSRTGILMDKSFTISESAAISPVVISGHDNQWARLTDENWGGGMRYEANFRDGKLQASGDWFLSRSEQGQLLRGVIPTRGRIEARSLTGLPSLISTFDFPIETLYFRDGSGGYWKAENVEPGKAFTCNEVHESEVQNFTAEAGKQLSQRSKDALLRGKGTPLSGRDNHFIAFTQAAPGIETFEGIDWQMTQTYITGPIVQP